MILFETLRQRNRIEEIMDDHSLDAEKHIRALRGLERINGWSQSFSVLWGPIRNRAMKTDKNPLRILDIATGAGDIPIRLWRMGRKSGIPLHIDACDGNPRAVAYAQEKAQRLEIPVRFFEMDVLKEPIPPGYEVVMSSLFLHHLNEEESLLVLQKMKASTQGLILVNDLVRSWAGWVLAVAGTQLLTRSDVVHIDGPRSVQSAYTIPEMRRLAARAGLDKIHLVPRWPCRFLLAWEKKS